MKTTNNDSTHSRSYFMHEEDAKHTKITIMIEPGVRS